jgi:hypothetical protein
MMRQQLNLLVILVRFTIITSISQNDLYAEGQPSCQSCWVYPRIHAVIEYNRQTLLTGKFFINRYSILGNTDSLYNADLTQVHGQAE